MGSKLRFMLMLFVVSEASPQRPYPPPPDEGHQPPPHEHFGPPMHNHGHHFERLRPLPDRPLSIGPPFFAGNNSPPPRFDNHHSRFDHNQQRIHHGPPHRPIDPDRDDNASINTESVRKTNNRVNYEKTEIVKDHETKRATTKIIIGLISEGLKKDIANLQNFANHGVNEARNRQSNNKNTGNIKMDVSTKNTLFTSTTPKIRDAANVNKKSERLETNLDAFNKVDSDLLEEIFGSAEDESSTAESTTEYETTTWDDFNRIGAPPAVVASLLG